MQDMFSRRSLLLSAPLLAQQPKPINVLFLAVDDLNTHVGCYGAPVKTPNIDALAAQGVRFDRAYCQYPLCNPSRSSLLTGRRPPLTGITNNNVWFRRRLPDVVTLPQFFRAHGYWTAQSGKIFHGGLDDDKAWVEGGTQLRENAPTKSLAERKPLADRWLALDGDGQDQADFRNADRAIKMLENRPKDKPFFFAAGFAKPHVPFLAPKKYFDLYDPAKIQLPRDFAPMPSGKPPAYRDNFDLFIQRQATPQLAREAIAGYYAATSFMDAELGKLLRAIDRMGLRENTVISFFGDHGFHLGEKGMWSKQTLFEPGTHVPMIVSAPRMTAGKSCGRTTELIDLYPTLADLCGLPAPRRIQGRSLKPLLQNPSAAWDKPAYTYQQRGNVAGASVRTERYRYTEWDGGKAGVELYDYSNDPLEANNLAGDAKLSAVIAGLKKLLAAGAD
ncbi:MAG: sulfatase [Bryobacterales bacterium]|nr:sulfatase [Bryobacterales bacterium]